MTDERRFDDLLREDAAALPPPAAGEINPWSMAMTRVLWGLGLITITLNFLYLDVILPAVGGLLLVLGFCTLRRENTPLRWCYILSLASLAVRGACIVLAALPVETGLAPAYVNIALLQVLYVCLWRGMVGVSRAAGEEKPAATAAGAMVVFYAVLTVLALIGVEGWLLVLPMLVLYILLLRSMVRLSRSLADTGYAITAAPVRLPDAAVLWGGLGVLLAAVLLAMFLGQRYPMDWHARDDAPQDETIRQQLLTKGFPSYVLDDLTAEEVSRMAGAVRVYRQVERLYSDTDYRTITTTHYMSDPDRPLVYDHTITDVDGEGERHYTYVYRVYDTLEQTMTHVAVELPEQDGVRRYIYIHHLTYAAPPSRDAGTVAGVADAGRLVPRRPCQRPRPLREKRHGAGRRLPHAEERQPTGQRPLRHPPDPADHRRLVLSPRRRKPPRLRFLRRPPRPGRLGHRELGQLRLPDRPGLPLP